MNKKRKTVKTGTIQISHKGNIKESIILEIRSSLEACLGNNWVIRRNKNVIKVITPYLCDMVEILHKCKLCISKLSDTNEWNFNTIIDGVSNTHIKNIELSSGAIESLVPYLSTANNDNFTMSDLKDICKNIMNKCKRSSRIFLVENAHNILIMSNDHDNQTIIQQEINHLINNESNNIRIQWKRITVSTGKHVISCIHEGIANEVQKLLNEEEIKYIKSTHVTTKRPNIHIMENIKDNIKKKIGLIDGAYVWNNAGRNSMQNRSLLQQIGNCVRSKIYTSMTKNNDPLKRMIHRIWPNSKIIPYDEAKSITKTIPFMKILYPEKEITPVISLCNTEFTILHMNVGKNKERMKNIIKKFKLDPSLILQNENGAPYHLIHKIPGFKILSNINASLEGNRYSYGSCIHIHNELLGLAKNITPNHDIDSTLEILWTEITFRNKEKLHICYTYVHHIHEEQTHDINNAKKFWNTLEDHINILKPKQLIIIGDMNIHLKRTGDLVESHNINKDRMLKIANTYDLALLNETFAFKQQTFLRSDKCSILDLIWCSKNLLKYINFMHVLPMTNNWKEHCPILLTLNLQVTKRNEKTCDQFIIPRKDKEWDTELERRIENDLKQINPEWLILKKSINSFGKIQQQEFLDCFTILMISILWKNQILTWGLRKRSDRSFRNKRKTLEILDKKMEKLNNNCSIQNISNITSTLFNNCKKETMALNKNESWEPTVNIIMEKYKKIFDNSTSNIFNNDFLDKKLEENKEFTKENEYPTPKENEIELILKEINMCKAKNQKAAAGLDMLYISNLNCAPAGRKDIENMIHEIMIRTGKYPTQGKISRLVPIPKIKGKSIIGNDRPISITTSLLKKFDIWLTKNLYSAKDTTTGFSEFSYGFQKNKSIRDNITLLKMASMNKKEKEKVYFIFFDISKCFDSIDRDLLQNTINELDMDNKIKYLIKEKYTNTKTTVNLGNTYSKSFNTKKGTLQGDTTSPVIFNIVFDKLNRKLEELQDKIQLTEKGKGINHSSYADDIVGIGITQEVIQELLTTTTEHAKLWRFLLNIAKCCILIWTGSESIANSWARKIINQDMYEKELKNIREEEKDEKIWFIDAILKLNKKKDKILVKWVENNITWENINILSREEQKELKKNPNIILTINHKWLEETPKINGKEIKLVNSFKYLGVWLNSHTKNIIDHTKNEKQSLARLACINRTLQQFKEVKERIPWNTFLNITNTLLKPMVTHNLEILELPQNILTRLQTNLSTSIRRLQPFFGIANRTLLHITGTINLELMAEKHKLNYWNMLVDRDDIIGRTIATWSTIRTHPMAKNIINSLKKIEWEKWQEENNKPDDNPIFWDQKNFKETIRNHINAINHSNNIEYFNRSMIEGTKQSEYILNYGVPFIANTGLKLPRELNKFGWDWISHLTGVDPWTEYDHRIQKSCPWCNEKTTQLGKHITTYCTTWDPCRKAHYMKTIHRIQGTLKDLKQLDEYEDLLEHITTIQDTIRPNWPNDPYQIKSKEAKAKFHMILLGKDIIFNTKGLINLNNTKYEIAKANLEWLHLVNHHKYHNTSPICFKENELEICTDNLPHDFIRNKGKKSEHDNNTKHIIRRNIEDFVSFIKSESVIIWTDGSKREEKTACAAIIYYMGSKITLELKLPDNTDINDAEMIAILCGISITWADKTTISQLKKISRTDLPEINPEEKTDIRLALSLGDLTNIFVKNRMEKLNKEHKNIKTHVFTDSKNCQRTLYRYEISEVKLKMGKIQKGLSTLQKNIKRYIRKERITIHKVPSHYGITENDEVDELAKNALNIEQKMNCTIINLNEKINTELGILKMATNIYQNRHPNSDEKKFLKAQLFSLTNNQIRILPNNTNNEEVQYINITTELNKLIKIDPTGLNITYATKGNKCAIHWMKKTITVDIGKNFINTKESTKNLHGLLLAIGNYIHFNNNHRILNIHCTSISTILNMTTNTTTNEKEERTLEKIKKLCKKMKLQLYPHISVNQRHDQKEVNRAINIRETNAWKFNPQIIEKLTKFFNLPCITADAFASSQNRQTNKYFSQWWEEDSWGVNFLEQNQDWKKEFIWANPPFKPYSILDNAAVFFHRNKVEGLLLIPKWERQKVWKTANETCHARIDILANKNLYCSVQDHYKTSATKQKWGTAIFYYNPSKKPNKKFEKSKFWKLNRDQKTFSIGSTSDK